MTDDQWNALFEPHRAVLVVLAQSLIEPKLRRKIDAQDVVQETFLAACGAVESMPQSGDSKEILRWLIEILKHKLEDTRRRYSSQKRDLKREKSVDACADQSIAGLEAMVPAVQTSPSGAASRNEHLAKLASAIQSLKESQREVVVERYINGRSLQETCIVLKKSQKSVAGLLLRGMTKLREMLT